MVSNDWIQRTDNDEHVPVELNAIIGWMVDAAEGRELSEFALSFAPVRLIQHLRRHRDELAEGRCSQDGSGQLPPIGGEQT